MEENGGRTQAVRSFRMSAANPRAGEVVCICEKSGNVSLFDPAAWARREYDRIHGSGAWKARGDARKKKR